MYFKEEREKCNSRKLQIEQGIATAEQGNSDRSE
jgi:hypothetical protein